MKGFFTEAYARLTSTTPVFFKKLGNMGMAAAAGGGALITPEIAGAHLPAIITKIGAHLLTIGAITKAISHFAVVDPTDPQAKPDATDKTQTPGS